MEIRIGAAFLLLVSRKIGSRSFGDIYLGENIVTHARGAEEVAIKLECVKNKHPQLHIEAKLYKLLLGDIGIGIPQVRWCGYEGGGLLGPSLRTYSTSARASSR